MSSAVVLLSGGLDSMLAIRILQLQGLQVEALNFRTVFTCCQDNAAQAAHELDVPLTVVGQEDDYIEIIRRPQYGYGKGANPCVDCRIYMFQAARAFADRQGAEVVASGEVVGQRPKSQKRRDLILIAEQSGLQDRLLRPLSARLLPPTRAEREGIVDRNALYGFNGRGRRQLVQLARELGLRTLPTPSTGCALTEKTFAGKVFDLIQLDEGSQGWDFELLRIGRHLRWDRQTKVVVGRRESENLQLVRMYQRPESRGTALLVPDNFAGPTVMVIGPPTEEALHFAGGLLMRFTSSPPKAAPQVRIDIQGRPEWRGVEPVATAMAATTL